jgi:hypothetical protein
VREEDVPQDPSFYKGHRRVCYAVGEDQRYVVAHSAGWEVERVATEQALLELEAEVEAARKRVRAGELAPLAYHLATRQMTPRLCAKHVGMAAWRVKRHLRPAVFARLSAEVLERYARCLDLPVAELSQVPDRAVRVFFEPGGLQPDGGPRP